MKYRIVERTDGFYPQERTCSLFNWSYIDTEDERFTWSHRYYSLPSCYEGSLETIERRKKYLQSGNVKKIHNL